MTLRGRTFKLPVVEFGECVWYLRLKSAGKDKMNTRWGSGVWLGIREESNEVFVGTDEGVVKCRSIRRKAGQDRWDKDLFNSIKGTPWEPTPGRLTTEVPINVRVPDEDQVIIPQTLSQEKDMVRRDFRIYKQDVKDYGLTPGCRGCLAADAGSLVSRNHTPECRQRFMREFEKNPERMLKITEQYLKKQDQDERQGITSAQVIGKAEDLPDKDEDQMEDTGARGSADPAPGSEEDVSMSNVVYSITANVASKQRFDEWEDKYKQRLRRGLNDDVKHMNEALAKEGFEHSIIEMYSPKRVNGIGEMLGLIQGYHWI